MSTELREVKLAWQALLKVLQHAKHFSPDFVTGQLLGMESDTSLEISDCFPFATNLSDETEQEEYQIEMMKSLRESNVDTNTVGWYQTCSFDAFVSSSLVDAQLVYQSTIPNSIVLIVDTAMSAMSCPNVRAFQVRPDYQDALLQSCATAATDKFGLIFKELPVIVSLSILDKLLLLQDSSCSKSLIPSAMSSAAEQSRLTGALFSNVLECVDDSIAEVGKMQYSLRNIVKHAHGASNRMKKRDESGTDHFHALKAQCEGTMSAFCHTVCQIEQFEKLLATFCGLSEEKMKFA